MVLQMIFGPIFLLIRAIINLLPDIGNVSNTIVSSFYGYVGIGLEFFGSGNFIIVITNILLWAGVHMVWAIIEWVYKKIPGVN